MDILGKIMISEAQLKEKVKELGTKISKDYEGETVLLIGVLKGACIFMSDLMRHITVDVNIDFMAVSSYGESTSSTGVVKIIKDLDSSIEGKHVIVVEDIIDSGLTLHYLVQNLEARKPKSVKVCTLLDKPERRKVNMTADYVGFEVENKFIVGYGLDFDEKYRNFPYITCLQA